MLHVAFFFCRGFLGFAASPDGFDTLLAFARAGALSSVFDFTTFSTVPRACFVAGSSTGAGGAVGCSSLVFPFAFFEDFFSLFLSSETLLGAAS